MPVRRTLMRRILSSFAEYEKERIVKKLKSARDTKSEKVGHRIEGQKRSSEELRTRARQLYRKPKGRNRRSLGQIAKIMTKEGWKSKMGKEINAQIVQGLLRKGKKVA